MSTIINPMTGKPVTIRIAKMNDGIAGRTKDSTPDNMTVYIDPIVPAGMYPTLVVHECCELKHMLKGDTYKTSHEAATDTEHKYVTKLGADWEAYNRNYIKMLNKVKSRGNSIKNPGDLFEGSNGERPSVRAANKGADVADVVPLAPLGGQKPSKPKVVGDCRTSDGKRTNCGNMPVVDKGVSRDEHGVCRDENGKWAGGCSGGSGGSSSKPGASKPSGNKPSGTKPSGSQQTGTKPSGSQQTGNKPAGNQQTGAKPAGSQQTGNKPAGNQQTGGGKETTQPAPRRNSDLPPWMQAKPKPEAKPITYPLTDTLPKLEPGQMKPARKIPALDMKNPETYKGLEYYPNRQMHPRSQRRILEPMVGQQVDFEYILDEIMTPEVKRSGKYLGSIPLGSVCIKDMSFVDDKGKRQKQDRLHMWFYPDQEFPPEFKDLKNLKKRQTATGVVGEYSKNDDKGRPTFKDINIKMLQNVHNKANKSMDTQKATEPDKNGRCHDEHTGALASCGGGSSDAPTSQGPGGGEDKKPESGKEPPKKIYDGRHSSALTHYASIEYIELNQGLRDKNPDKRLNSKQKAIVEAIDDAFKVTEPLKNDLTVYRGIHPAVFGDFKDVVGMEMTDPGFMSTSTDVETAKGFGNCVMTIRVPKGYKAINMPDVSQTAASKYEHEQLLPRNTKIVIDGVRQDKGGFLGIGKKTYLRAHVVV